MVLFWANLFFISICVWCNTGLSNDLLGLFFLLCFYLVFISE